MSTESGLIGLTIEEFKRLKADSIRAEILQSSNTKLKELLKSLEWIDNDTDENHCPICRNFKSSGHAKDCALSKALEETK